MHIESLVTHLGAVAQNTAEEAHARLQRGSVVLVVLHCLRVPWDGILVP